MLFGQHRDLGGGVGGGCSLVGGGVNSPASMHVSPCVCVCTTRVIVCVCVCVSCACAFTRLCACVLNCSCGSTGFASFGGEACVMLIGRGCCHSEAEALRAVLQGSLPDHVQELCHGDRAGGPVDVGATSEFQESYCFSL